MLTEPGLARPKSQLIVRSFGVDGCSLALMDKGVSDPGEPFVRAEQFDHGRCGQSSGTEDPSRREPP